MNLLQILIEIISSGFTIAAMTFVGLYWFFSREAKKTPATLEPQENICRLHRYWLTRIRNAASDLELQYLETEVRAFEINFFEDPDISTFMDELKEALQMRWNDLAVTQLVKVKV